MMNYLKERIEGMSEHTIEQDHEIGDLQTRTGNDEDVPIFCCETCKKERNIYRRF
jgi:hypothetical protein